MRFHARIVYMPDDSVGQISVCDGVYIGVNNGFSECDVNTGVGTGEDDGEGEDIEDNGACMLVKTTAMVKTLKMMAMVMCLAL